MKYTEKQYNTKFGTVYVKYCSNTQTIKNNIQAMKTTNNFRTLASMTIVSAALLFATATQAGATRTNAETRDRDAAAATYRLDNLTGSIETSVLFVAAEVNPGEDMMHLENEAAMDRMDLLTNSLEKSVRFQAPELNAREEAEAFEAKRAVDSLDELTRQIETSLYYQAPAAE